MISITTVTQLCRKDTIKLTAEYINYQTYLKLIKEWVIVEGSRNEKDAEENKILISKLQELTEVPIKYISYIPNLKIGALRNKCNENCSYENIVCMDDDDFYRQDYVEQHYKAL